MFSRSNRAICDIRYLFPRVSLERNFNHKRKVWNFTTPWKHLRKMESEMLLAPRPPHSSPEFATRREVCVSQIEKSFPAHFFGIQNELHWKLQNRTCEESENREETRHVSEFIYSCIPSGLLSSFKKKKKRLFLQLSNQRTTLSRKREICICIASYFSIYARDPD